MEGLTTTGNVNDMNATPGNDNGVQRFPNEIGTVAGMCYNLYLSI